MRVTVLANRDIASCLALNRLLPQLAQQQHRVSVFLSSSVGKRKAPDAAPPPAGLAQLKFIEQRLFNEAIFPIVDSVDATGASTSAQPPPRDERLLTFSGLQHLTAQPVETLNDINGGGLSRFTQTAPDLVLSIRYGVILREEAIAVPRHGVLNLHSGLLPAYRGVMASFHALLNGDDSLGMTLHTIDDRTIDTGRVLGTTALPVRPERSYLWHVLALYDDGVDLMAAAVQSIADGEPLEAVPQPKESLATPRQNYHTFPTQAELDALAAKGHSLYDAAEMLALARRFGGL